MLKQASAVVISIKEHNYWLHEPCIWQLSYFDTNAKSVRNDSQL